MNFRRLTLPTPNPIDATGIVSWVHFGDLHITNRAEANYKDFTSLVEEVNQVMKTSLNFAYLPGDIAEHGTADEYEAFREVIDRLQLPWFAIVGDHDVHQRTHANYFNHVMPMTFYAFDVGTCRFFALDAFASADPGLFDLSGGQIECLNGELSLAHQESKQCVLLLHCYPSELGKTSEPLRRLIRDFNVLLVDMGHTHYNEIANDGKTLYTSTRSTGQIEEGPVGFSITNIDSGVVSWAFKTLGNWPLVMITFPGDERLQVRDSASIRVAPEILPVRVRAWSDKPIAAGSATIGETTVTLLPARGAIWKANLPVKRLSPGLHTLHVEVVDAAGKIGVDSVRVAIGTEPQKLPRHESQLETEHIVGPWPERGLLGTQLGPNKNGRKW